jgi:hypothetical protein
MLLNPIFLPTEIYFLNNLLKNKGNSQDFSNSIKNIESQEKNLLFFYSLKHLRFDICNYFLEKDPSFFINFENKAASFLFHNKNEKIFFYFYKKYFIHNQNHDQFFKNFYRFQNPERHLFFLKKFSIDYSTYLEIIFTNSVKSNNLLFALILLKKNLKFIDSYTTYISLLLKNFSSKMLDEQHKVISIFSFIFKNFQINHSSQIINLLNFYSIINLQIMNKYGSHFDKKKYHLFLQKTNAFFEELIELFLKNCTINIYCEEIINHSEYPLFEKQFTYYQLHKDLKSTSENSNLVKI